jgi:TonB family protein
VITGLGLHDREDTPAEPPRSEVEPPFLAAGTIGPPPRGRDTAVVASAIVHALLVMLVVPIVRAPPAPEPHGDEPPRVMARLRFPPAARAARERPPPVARERISVGPPDERRAETLVLRRDEDLAQPAQGLQHDVVGADAVQQRAVPAAPERSLASGEGPSARPRTLQDAAARLVAATDSGAWGTPSGTTQRMGPLQFDPQGADFTRWIQHFKSEVYRNWVIPESANWGWTGGEVAFTFVVERDGAMTSLADLSSTGTRALDHAARNALEASRLLPLPSDYAPPSVTMTVVFTYGVAGQQARAAR